MKAEQVNFIRSGMVLDNQAKDQGADNQQHPSVTLANVSVSQHEKCQHDRQQNGRENVMPFSRGLSSSFRALQIP